MREKLIKKFGKEIENIEGLLEFLENEERVEDVKIESKEKVAAFVLDQHWWGGSSGIGMAAIVGVCRDGKIKTKKFVYRDQWDPRKDNYYLAFNKVKIMEVDPYYITVKAIAEDNQEEIAFALMAKSAKPKD